MNVDGETNTSIICPNKKTCFTGEAPYEGKEFISIDEAYNYYNSYAKKTSFGIRKESADKLRKSGTFISQLFVCNEVGRKKLTDMREHGKLVIRRPDTRVDCPTRMKIKLTSSKTWVVTKFVVEHPTHLLSSPDKVLNYYSHRQRHRSKTCKSFITNLSEEGMAPSTIAHVYNVVCKSTNEEQVTAQQCIDHIRTVRKNNIGNECISIIKHFQDRKEIDPDFYFSMEVDQFGSMRSVFWANGRSRSSYLTLGDVVVFDVTYKTNHLSLPFAPFTGVNQHRQSILFGCALLADEQRDTFIWLFTQWLKCMHGVAPKAITTDQDAQIGEAIKHVFPNSHHRFCSWHIGKHIAERQLPMKSQYGDEITIYFDKWYWASTIHKCEERWKVLKEKFKIDENADNWLPRMYRLRTYWVDAYLKDIFWAGMTTSQRSESINAFFEGYVNAKTSLVDFVRQYDKAVANRRASESREDFMTLNAVPAMCLGHPIEVQVSKLYTRKIFKIFQNELTVGLPLFHEEMQNEGPKEIYLVGDFSEEREKWEEVTCDRSGELKVVCTCALFETEGILCRHILHITWLLQLTSIPSSFLLHRWRIDARHRNVQFYNMMNLRNNECSMVQRGIIRLWALRAQFNVTLEIVSDLDTYISKI